MDPSAARYANPNWEEKIQASFSVKEKLFPARAEFHMRHKTNVTRETLFFLTLTTSYANQDWEEKSRPSFSVEEKLFPARQVRRKNTSTLAPLLHLVPPT